MKTELKMGEHNRGVYLELLKDMRGHGDGLFSFILRISSGEIVDYVVMDNLPPETLEYGQTNITVSN